MISANISLAALKNVMNVLIESSAAPISATAEQSVCVTEIACGDADAGARTMYALRREVFSARILDIIGEPSGEADAQAQREEAYRQKILQNFFEYGRLTAIPAQRKKRRICLEEIARAFEVGKPYAESEVNDIIGRYHEDYCTLRREMICEGIMERSNGTYVRKS